MEALVHDAGQLLLADQFVDLQLEHVVEAFALHEAQVLRQRVVEDQPAEGGIDELAARFFPEGAGDPDLDGGLQGNLAEGVSHDGFVLGGEDPSGALGAVMDDGQVVTADNHILGRRDDGAAVLRLQDVVVGQHQEAGFRLGFHGQRDVHGHLVAVEVGVEGGTGQRMQLDGLAFDQDGLKGLDAQTVQGRRAVQQHRMIPDDFFQDIPDLGLNLFDSPLGGFYIVGQLQADQPLHDEGLEQLQRHFLGQAALR